MTIQKISSKFLMLLFPLASLLSGCGGAISGWVDAARPGVKLPNAVSDTALPVGNGFKATNGSVTSQSASVSMKATISPTQQNFTSNKLGATLSLSRQ